MPQPANAAHACPTCGGRLAPAKHVLRAAFGMELPEDEESTRDEFHDATHFEPGKYLYARGGKIGGTIYKGGGGPLASVSEPFDGEGEDECSRVAFSKLRRYAAGGTITSLSDPFDSEDEGTRGDVQFSSARRYARGGACGHYSHGGTAVRHAAGCAEGGKVPDADLGPKRDAELPDYRLDVYQGENVRRAQEKRARDEAAERAREREEEDGRGQLASARGYAHGGLPDDDREDEPEIGDTYAAGGRAKLGSGKRFAAVERSAAASGARNPAAVAAVAGREKYGAKKMAALSAHGRAAHRAGGGSVPSFAEHMARRLGFRRAMGAR